MTIADQTRPLTTAEPAASAQPATAFTVYWLFQSDPNRRPATDAEREQATQSMLDAIARHGDSVQVRGAYSTTGLSAGVDLILWLIADDCDAFQSLASEIHCSPALTAIV